MGEANRRKQAKQASMVNPGDLRIIAKIDTKLIYEPNSQAVMSLLSGEAFDVEGHVAGTVLLTPGGIHMEPIKEIAKQLGGIYIRDIYNCVILSMHNGSGLGGPNPISNVFVHVKGDEFMYIVFISPIAFADMPKDVAMTHLVKVCDLLNQY